FSTPLLSHDTHTTDLGPLSLHDALPIYKQYREYVDSRAEAAAALYLDLQDVLEDDDRAAAEALLTELRESYPGSPYTDQAGLLIDRKSTRLNSSHVKISYAVFCLKKKKC